jgi:hypothetical protein
MKILITGVMKYIQYHLILSLVVKREKMAVELKLWVVKSVVELMISVMAIKHLDGWNLSVSLFSPPFKLVD